MKTAFRIFTILILVAVALFCAFGFLASFEYPEPLRRLPWQAGYGGIGLACIGAIVFQCRRFNGGNRGR